ncbi:MAG TPA: M56 family metallopeptidase [Verrucomicrobiae bacterium]|nr:M56 family metallopeptidase [Verrucomicrobiae bacterium]
MTLQSFSAIWKAAAPALGNHLWQSTLFAILAGLLAWTLRRNQARVRYWLWMAASIKFLVPFSLLVGVGSRFSWSHSPAGTNGGLYFVLEGFSRPFAEPAPATVFSSAMNLLPAILAVAWLLGFATVLLVWLMRYGKIAAAIKHAKPLQEGREVEALRRLAKHGGTRKKIEFFLSSASLEPGIMGIVRPVLLWPAGISERLDDAHLEAILAHEVWHVRRHDNLAAAGHMLVEAIFWFHPLVWWLGARLVEERERACDEEVLDSGSERQVYAESILKICEFCVGSPLACVSGVTGADLKKRIVNIMTKSVQHKLDFSRKLLLSLAAVLSIALPITFGLARPEQSRAQSFSISAANGSAFTHGYQEVSITPGDSGNGVIQTRIRFTPDSLMVKNQTLQALIKMAYGVQDSQILGGPDWINTARFNLEAKLDSSIVSEMKKLSEAQQKIERDLMFQALLADQFKVVLHRESRLLPAYALVIAKNGPKVQAAKPGDTYPNGIRGLDGQPAGPHKFDMNSGVFTVQAMPMTFITDHMSMHLNQPVVDRTGLAGDYDFTLRLPHEGGMPDHQAGNGGQAAHMHTMPVGGINQALIAAIEEQLGLRLDQQTVPLPVLMVDRAEKPSTN